jgi:Skp family chaperone for outer membrane proteins
MARSAKAAKWAIGAGLVLGVAGAAGWGMSQRLATPTSVALVDIEKLFGQLDEMKARQGKFQQQIDAYQAEIKGLTEEIDRLKADVQTANYSEAERRAVLVEIYEKEALRKAKAETRERLADLERGEIFRNTYQRALTAIETIASQQGYDIVMLDDRKLPVPVNAPSRDIEGAILNKRVLFASGTNNVDITALVLSRMNNDFAAGN